MHNTGLSVTVKLGSTTLTTTADLDAAFDTIAHYFANSTLTVTYNTAGRAALRESMDCVFDHGWVTLSTVWLNHNVSDVAVRTYGVLAVNSSNQPLWTGSFDSVDPDGTYTILHFNDSSGDCLAVYATARATYDLESNFTSSLKPPISCGSDDDCLKCKRSGTSCSCKSAEGSCFYSPIVSTETANGGIVKVTF